MGQSLFYSELPHLELLNRGKVRDIYAYDRDYMLIVTSDRISAFDVVLPRPIPGRGEMLTRMSKFWFDRNSHLLPNHQSSIPLAEAVPDAKQRECLGERAVVVKKLTPLPLEAIVRGYLIGSGWKDYCTTGALCGVVLPRGLQQGAKLPEVLYTPSTKAEVGAHDENISFAQTVALVGAENAARVRDLSIQIYTEAALYARQRGIIIADTKFEFGLDRHEELHLIDEVLTPDSSRFWPANLYRPGISPPSYDKQFMRDYLETLDWDKTAPAPDLPLSIITRTMQKYAEAERVLTSAKFTVSNHRPHDAKTRTSKTPLSRARSDAVLIPG